MILWHFPPKDLTLFKDSVHIWSTDLNLPTELLTNLTGILSLDERQRAERFYFEPDKKKFIACRGLLRIILSRYLNLAPDRLEFTYALQGKPELNNTVREERLCFNVSHSHNLAVYAIALNRSVGIDLEYLRQIPNVQQLAERFFSPNEYTIINTLPKEQQQEVFFRFWTIKEAYLKATGEGLAGLQKIAVSFTQENSINLYHTENNILLNKHWFCTEFKPGPDYAGALVVQGENLAASAIANRSISNIEYFNLTKEYILNHWLKAR